MTPETADAILGQLDKLSWGKGEKGVGMGGLDYDDGPICLAQAISRVTSPEGLSLAPPREYVEATREVYARTQALFPGRSTIMDGIPGFNDHKDTTLEDVILVVKSAVDG